MRQQILKLTFILALLSMGAYAQTYSTSETPIGTLLDDPAAAAIIEKYMPGFASNEQISMARSLTLTSLQTFAPETVTDAVLVEIDTDLAKLPQAE